MDLSAAYEYTAPCHRLIKEPLTKTSICNNKVKEISQIPEGDANK